MPKSKTQHRRRHRHRRSRKTRNRRGGDAYPTGITIANTVPFQDNL